MPSPNIFASPASGPVPLPHHAEETPQNAGVLHRKRSADALENLSPAQKRVRREAEEREQRRFERLESDPLCIVRADCGHAVQCDRCGSVIKLSHKNNFDPQHWTKHRRLCVRRRDAVAASMRAASSLGPRKTPQRTPELTTDAASDTTGTSVCTKSEPSASPAPSPPPPESLPAVPWLDHLRRHQNTPLTSRAACAAYMAVAHPDVKQYDPADMDVFEEIRAWTPARVRPPVCFPRVDIDEAKLRLTSPARWPVAEECSDMNSDDEDAVDSGAHARVLEDPQSLTDCESQGRLGS